MGGRSSNSYRGNSTKYSLVGMYTEKRSQMSRVGGNQVESGVLMPELSRLANTYFWTAYSSIYCHYVAIATVCLVVLLSYMLPNISYKIHRTTELKAMKKVLDVMAKEVSRAEVACLTVADEISCLQCSMQDGSTETTNDIHDLAVCTSDSMRGTQSAPAVHVEKKMGFFRRIFFPHRNTSNKEVAIMSYLYTDSFDGSKAKNGEDTPTDLNINN